MNQNPQLETELKVHEVVMRLIGEEKISSDLGSCLVVALDQNDKIVYANDPLYSKVKSSKILLGKNFRKLSTLTKEDLDKNEEVIINNLFKKLKVSWFIIKEGNLKILIENETKA
jgi:hypothetical protein